MTPERWRRIEEIFQAVVEQPNDQRETFLARACGGDDELRREVASLLAHEGADGFIQSLIAGGSHLLERHGDETIIGSHIGVYRVTGLIGHGGMGTVYAAVRDDDVYRQQVALKVVKRGMDTQSIVHRFRHERQILASLEHPNIARLLDGGTTHDGLPYFVMEHITGQTITRYCENHKISLAEKLRLFRQVCAAVQYAHQKLIIHRDLKPSNILVTDNGQSKLLDFGIAKLLTAEDGAEALTGTGVRLMTPDYASPEQVYGQSVTTATDIYGLGLVLYELLTAQKLHRFKSRSAVEIERVVCETEITKPSILVNSAKLRRQLSGDLDNIALMALRREPERRYQSAEQFSDDVRRYLAGLPVRARQDTVGYRAGKFARRHKLVLAAAMLVVLSLIGG
ncbi:MAG TPA: serine/threonine-protein kinase, partial [Pyrinomonadaceae bacterium]|nr:serine/threonine-protein kinase [Pyrinomonadaceae bacterium]